jgi:hypothetical protein
MEIIDNITLDVGRGPGREQCDVVVEVCGKVVGLAR